MILDNIFWATGALVCTGIAFGVVWLIGEFIWAGICAVSLTRFFVRVARADPTFSRAIRRNEQVRQALGEWFDLLGHRSGCATYTYRGKAWRGISDYDKV